ncbi:GTP 3',8-cyclase MoaA [Virgibacillus sp. DJP39]|uniref:GTP 3',8-cyclase MoaA n=1 Tax=Virgibacillus sp. DJP39 TaxID=3409790 RepID=UPI003BB7BA6D
MNREKNLAVTDKFNRPLQDLRISVTDRCNFRCTYCMPAEVFGADYPFLQKKELLSFEEITRVAQTFAKLGVSKIRITGGEPLMRRDLEHLIKKLSDIPEIKDIAMTTNGSLLPKKAAKLKEAGLDRVTISLDSLDDEKFGEINGKGVKVQTVLDGIDAAQAAGLEVKVNMLVKRGVNEHDILPVARMFQGSSIILRFIEFMDVGSSNGWKLDDVISKKEILETLQSEMTLEPVDPNYYGEVATLYRNTETGDQYGIISSITAPFCSSCTRARLSADGKIYTCLFAVAGTDIHTPLRNGASNLDLEEIVSQTWGNRSDRYSEIRTTETVNERKKQKIEMSYIGG